MQRTTIYLSDEQQRVLSARARTEDISTAELIRLILDEALGLRTTPAPRLEAVEATAGIWSDRTDDELATRGSRTVSSRGCADPRRLTIS